MKIKHSNISTGAYIILGLIWATLGIINFNEETFSLITKSIWIILAIAYFAQFYLMQKRGYLRLSNNTITKYNSFGRKSTIMLSDLTSLKKSGTYLKLEAHNQKMGIEMTHIHKQSHPDFDAFINPYLVQFKLIKSI